MSSFLRSVYSKNSVILMGSCIYTENVGILKLKDSADPMQRIPTCVRDPKR